MRPILLLNVDYKILTKVIAKRIEKTLPKIINPERTGYVKGRYIGENIRLIQDVMFLTKRFNMPGIAIFLDFRKAFDTIKFWPRYSKMDRSHLPQCIQLCPKQWSRVTFFSTASRRQARLPHIRASFRNWY